MLVKLLSRTLGLFCLLLLFLFLAWMFNRSAQRLKMSRAEPGRQIGRELLQLPETPGLAQATDNEPVSPAPTLTPPDPRKLLRRAFRPALTVYGSARPDIPAIEIEGRRIFTDSGNKLTLSSDTQGRAAYFVQFNDRITPADRALVEDHGGMIHGYIPHDALAVDLDARQAKRLAREPSVRGILPVIPEYKMQPFLMHLVEAETPGIPATLPVTVSLYRPEDVAEVVTALQARGLSVLAADAGRRWGWIRVEAPRERIREIAAHPRVQWLEEYVEPDIANDQAVIASHLNVTNAWNQHGLTGAGQIIGHADTGLDVGDTNVIHPDFAGRIVAAFARGRVNRWDDPQGHGTHTAGSILGGGIMSTGVFRGVAWQAGLVHQSLLGNSGGLSGLPSNLNELYLQAYTHGARVHSDSWGSSVFGAYTTSSRQSDEFMWDYPDMLLVFAAGNDGWDSGDGIIDPDSVGAPASAKNVITVGAAESDRAPGSGGFSSSTYGSLWPWDYPAQPIRDDYVSQSHDLIRQGMAAFSSRGPTEDGRIKPDVVAPGTDVISTKSRAPGSSAGWGLHPNTNYHFYGGTSMSTPLVAGSAALVRQYLSRHRFYPQPSAALVKTILMHGARSLTPGQYGAVEFQEVPGVSPNMVEGWGHVDMERSLFPKDQSWFYADEKVGLTSPGSTREHIFYAGTGAVKITLHYTDFPASSGSGKKLVNDLDLTLAGPGGFDPMPARDRTNNTEQIHALIHLPGVYTARVEAINVPSGPQRYALVAGGPVNDVPAIEHQPLANTYVTNEPYRVSARIHSAAELAPGAVTLYWRSSSSADFAAEIMVETSNHWYEGWVPAHPAGHFIEYYLSVSSAVFMVYAPVEAASQPYSFLITEPLTLVVSGTPAPIFSVDPDYGAHVFASGNVVRLTAPAHVAQAPGIRLAVSGWSGTGSVPASGISNDLSFVIRENSAIEWAWITQYALAQTSSVAGLLSATTWWHAWVGANSLTAATEPTLQGTHYGLAGWTLDGLRQPNAGSAAVNPLTGIIMYGPRAATAVYLPATQDANTNGLPDWWEQFYFGTNNSTASLDPDGDGFTNIKEFQDRTHPRDAAVFPQSPAIAHVPLDSPQTNPAPWAVRATIVDNFAVSNAVVFLQRNAGAWTSSVMTVSALTNFSGSISGPATNGDVVVYRIEAADFAGLKAVSGPYAVSVAYAKMDAFPASLGLVDLPADTASNVWLVVTNPGLAQLTWTLTRALEYDAIESGTNRWTHGGNNDVWHIQTRRFASRENAWHFGSGPGGLYPDSANAWLNMAPIYLDAPARLRFRHWAQMEYDDEQNDDHYWDGGVVEVAVEPGTNYVMIAPVGGYPHRITANPASPFPPDTPCYGKTEGWQPAEFDLSAFTGQTLHIRFRFGSDAYVREEGWYLDDFVIEYQDDASWHWLEVAGAGRVEAQTSSNVMVRLDTADLLPAEQRWAKLVMSGNDPERNAPIIVPVGLHNATREIAVSFSDYGTVLPAGSVRVLQGASTSFWAMADVFYMISGVFTNGDRSDNYIGAGEAAIAWTNIQSNGTLYVQFAEKMAAGLVPEWWLYLNGLTNQTPEAEAQTDHDADGMLSWQEFRAGTDPNDDQSVEMVILHVSPTRHDHDTVLSWLSFTNPALQYQLHRATNFNEGFWVYTNLIATPPLNVFTNTGTEGFMLFRVLSVPPE